MIRAILFDLGNTLLEYEARPFKELFNDASRTLHERLVSREVQVPDAARFANEFEEIFELEEEREGGASGRVVRNSITRLLDRYGVQVADSELPELLVPFYEAMSQQVIVYPDTLRTLIELKQSGLKLGVVANTNWPKEFHLRDLARYELLSLFDTLVFSSDEGCAKPDPEIYRRALARLDVEPSEAILVGDNPIDDVQGAQSAGIRGILKFHPRAPKAGPLVRPDARVEALNQLPSLIEEWNPAIA